MRELYDRGASPEKGSSSNWVIQWMLWQVFQSGGREDIPAEKMPQTTGQYSTFDMRVVGRAPISESVEQGKQGHSAGSFPPLHGRLSNAALTDSKDSLSAAAREFWDPVRDCISAGKRRP